jgi:hypothetical protein
MKIKIWQPWSTHAGKISLHFFAKSGNYLADFWFPVEARKVKLELKICFPLKNFDG